MAFELPLITSLSNFLSGGASAANTCSCTGTGYDNDCKNGSGGIVTVDTKHGLNVCYNGSGAMNDTCKNGTAG